MKMVSVIVPVYNAEKYVGICIDSILNQTYQNFELLLINDGSIDNSFSILEDYAKKDKRIRVIQQKNMGVAKTRNKGIQMARGEYVTFIDNDDYIEVDYLEQFIKNCDDQDIVIGGYRRVDLSGKILKKFILKDTDWAKYTFITPWARIFKKEFLLKNKIEFFSYPIGEDVYFNLKAYSLTDKIKIISYIGYNWLYNDCSVSNTIHKGFNEKVDIIFLLNQIYQLREIGNQKFIDYYCYKFGIWYLLYSGKGAEKSKFLQEYATIKEWNQKNAIKMNINPFSRKLTGEMFLNRCSIFTFWMIEKLHLVSIFASFYCK